jgi:hypothetical protein
MHVSFVTAEDTWPGSVRTVVDSPGAAMDRRRRDRNDDHRETIAGSDVMPDELEPTVVLGDDHRREIDATGNRRAPRRDECS